ncbi:MAG TPA: hypothetical protein VM223_14535, partial [Planctomycetota bacterium]|nr:hypothetical protein [Planctomycetota bacterium]
MEKNFEKKYGYPSPTFADVIPYIQPLLDGKMPNDPKVGERWENYMTFINTLMFDFYDNLRHSVGPLDPALQYSNRGPSWGGDTESGTYPGIANANQSPLPVFTGHGDYSHWFIWWMMPAAEFYRTSGHETWGICGAGNVTLYRHHLGMALMSGAKGFGYLRGGKPEDSRITGPWLCDDIDEMMEIRDLLHTYGPIIRKVDHTSTVGVYYPFVQSMYDTAGMAGHSTEFTAMSAMMQLSLLGYSYDVLTDEMIDAGELSRFKVVVAPLMYYLLPKQ